MKIIPRCFNWRIRRPRVRILDPWFSPYILSYLVNTLRLSQYEIETSICEDNKKCSAKKRQFVYGYVPFFTSPESIKTSVELILSSKSDRKRNFYRKFYKLEKLKTVWKAFKMGSVLLNPTEKTGDLRSPGLLNPFAKRHITNDSTHFLSTFERCLKGKAVSNTYQTETIIIVTIRILSPRNN